MLTHHSKHAIICEPYTGWVRHPCFVCQEAPITTSGVSFASFQAPWTRFVTPFDASKSIEVKLAAASGRSVLVQRDQECSSRASIKIALDDDHAHVLRYKPELESDLPYLSAFQCVLALRSLARAVWKSTIQRKSTHYNRYPVSTAASIFARSCMRPSSSLCQKRM